MILAAFMVSGFVVASVYAVALLRGRRDRYHRLGFLIPFTASAVIAPVRIAVGDYAARFLATYQPTKLAAIEGVYHTGSHIPLTVAGFPVGGQLRYGLEIPDGLSLLVGYSPNTVITGLDRVPVADRPPVGVVHLSFDVMVCIGSRLRKSPTPALRVNGEPRPVVDHRAVDRLDALRTAGRGRQERLFGAGFWELFAAAGHRIGPRGRCIPAAGATPPLPTATKWRRKARRRRR
ncbi:MAG: hypothetical protein DLM62_14495 [Pseudonocardiales bacterium]|nr:MAG: hypothetical protein DLM62_14495 [Pseudonocardiales bacterium]